MSTTTDHFPFLQLPGELRNQIYREVLRLKEPTNEFLSSSLLRTPNSSTKGTFTTAWTLSQHRMVVVVLCDLAAYAQVFYPAPKAAKLGSTQHVQLDTTFVSTKHHALLAVEGLDARFLDQGIALLPLLHALDYTHGVELDFGPWASYERELDIVHLLHNSWATWRADITTLGILDMHLRTAYSAGDSYILFKHHPRSSNSISLTLRCTPTAHTSEKKRVRDLCAWVWKSGLARTCERDGVFGFQA
ncbi:uncharacterized protein N0V89_009046 [Didymosphaeria variabile]|uniref:Uncharacterized protein n=1 Tax=Didymosphaeria variabile TaxID=1932322 RepID=A0A9W8XHF1_9PLEO|nr:uncharacterized protein N0V89_009046 [Didymosphaeria variabile]KAJ4350425.1 hypothetical protein N0V89_009046 [Didymosphaeria variabile]